MVYLDGARRNEGEGVAPGPNVYYLGKKEPVDLALASFAPRMPRLLRPGEAWKKLLKPLIVAVVGATFLGQAVAFFHQLTSGEKQFDD